VSQGVLLSLLQQLGSDLASLPANVLPWIREAALALDPQVSPAAGCSICHNAPHASCNILVDRPHPPHALLHCEHRLRGRTPSWRGTCAQSWTSCLQHCRRVRAGLPGQRQPPCAWSSMWSTPFACSAAEMLYAGSAL
jgi:hypothetical protein